MARSRGLGDVYKRQPMARAMAAELLAARHRLAALDPERRPPTPDPFASCTVVAYVDETFVHETDPATGALRLPGMP
jgi:hypothetical protein